MPRADLPCAPPPANPGTTWSWCGADVCFEPDAHNHTRGDCWLKFSEVPHRPEVNMRSENSEVFRERHPAAPERVEWVAGAVLPRGVGLENGTWSPRAAW